MRAPRIIDVRGACPGAIQRQQRIDDVAILIVGVVAVELQMAACFDLSVIDVADQILHVQKATVSSSEVTIVGQFAADPQGVAAAVGNNRAVVDYLLAQRTRADSSRTAANCQLRTDRDGGVRR